MESKKKTSMVFNCLIKKDGPLFVGHCLELDIVSTSDTFDGVKGDLNDLIRAQVDFAFTQNNLDYLYHPAPPDAWEEFYRCKCAQEEKISLASPVGKKPHAFIPPWIIAKMCMSRETCRV
jgi:hypothetical protein